MESNINGKDIVLLFEKYSLKSQYLHKSLLLAGFDSSVIVLEEDYFLPIGVMSVYDLLLEIYGGSKENSGKSKYFNEIKVPDRWSISIEGNTKFGKIYYRHEEKGRIYYSNPIEKHLVKAVDWYDRNGIVRCRDEYNRYGDICARIVYDSKGQPINKSWISIEGKEIAVENYRTGDIVLNDDGVMKFFSTKIDLIVYVFVKAGFEQKRIFFNSLSTVFLISDRLKNSIKKDVLFWEETVDEIPEKMKMILEGKSNRISKIIVQKRDAYNRLLELGVERDMVCKLGFIYPFKKKNRYRPEALICTNSEWIEHCQELIEAFPQIQFHIAAITEMSPNLMHLETYDNVKLYPRIRMNALDELFEICDYYFDINHWTEMASSVYRAFLSNHLIFAFQETVHNREYVADSHIYSVGEFGKMVSDIKAILENEDLMEQHLAKQHEDALVEEKDAYVRMIEM